MAFTVENSIWPFCMISIYRICIMGEDPDEKAIKNVINEKAINKKNGVK